MTAPYYKSTQMGKVKHDFAIKCERNDRTSHSDVTIEAKYRPDNKSNPIMTDAISVNPHSPDSPNRPPGSLSFSPTYPNYRPASSSSGDEEEIEYIGPPWRVDGSNFLATGTTSSNEAAQPVGDTRPLADRSEYPLIDTLTNRESAGSRRGDRRQTIFRSYRSAVIRPPPQSVGNLPPSSRPAGPNKRGRPPKKGRVVGASIQTSTDGPTGETAAPKRRGRRPKNAVPNPTSAPIQPSDTHGTARDEPRSLPPTTRPESPTDQPATREFSSFRFNNLELDCQGQNFDIEWRSKELIPIERIIEALKRPMSVIPSVMQQTPRGTKMKFGNEHESFVITKTSVD